MCIPPVYLDGRHICLMDCSIYLTGVYSAVSRHSLYGFLFITTILLRNECNIQYGIFNRTNDNILLFKHPIKIPQKPFYFQATLGSMLSDILSLTPEKRKMLMECVGMLPRCACQISEVHSIYGQPKALLDKCLLDRCHAAAALYLPRYLGKVVIVPL